MEEIVREAEKLAAAFGHRRMDRLRVSRDRHQKI
jgi:hypothetical protein